MTQNLGWFLILCVLAYVVWRLVTRGERAEAQVVRDRTTEYEHRERQFMPREIAQGTLVLSEQYFRTRVPRKLGAQVDQVYLTPEGFLVPVETKRRFKHHVRPYDQIELSVQAAVLRHAAPSALAEHEVATWGWVRIAPPGRRPQYLRTKLLDDDQIGQLYDRYEELLEGDVEPGTAEHPAVCRKCAHVSRCPNALAVPC